MHLREESKDFSERNRQAYEFAKEHNQCAVSEIDGADVVLLCSENEFRTRETAGILSGALIKTASVDLSRAKELAKKIKTMGKAPLVVLISEKIGLVEASELCSRHGWSHVRYSPHTEIYAMAVVVVGLTKVHMPYVAL